MKHGDAAFGAQRAKRVFELARLVQGLVDERLDDRLAERRQLAAAIAADETLHAGEPDALDLVRLFVQHDHSGLTQDSRDFFGLAAFVIVVAEHSEHGNRARADVFGEDLGLARLAEIGEVAAQHAARRLRSKSR